MALEQKEEHGTARQPITADGDFSQVDENVLRVDVACGLRLKKGWLGFDRVEVPIPEGAEFKLCDLTAYPWPLEDNSVYEIKCSHYVEHVGDLDRFMQEVYRVLMIRGTAMITAPYQFSLGAWQDPSHVRAINENTFCYYSQPTSEKLAGRYKSLGVNFELVNIRYLFSPEWEPRAEEAKKWALKHYNNVVSEIMVTLRKLEVVSHE